MRFFISSDMKRNRPLYFSVLFFWLFSFLFWIASWLHFYSKYGFSKESLTRYFFMDSEFPERISLAQVSEDFHVGIFLHSTILIILFSLLNITGWKNKLKLTLIALSSILMLIYLASDFIILWIGISFVLLKLLSFLLYQLIYLLLLIFVFIGITKNNNKAQKSNLLKIVSFTFAIFSLVFLFSNLLNFYTKMGFSPKGIKDYFLGNPELFIKKKSFEGLFKVLYPHIVAVGIYSLVVAHLLPFTGMKRNKSLYLGLFIFLSSSMNHLFGLLLLYLGSPFDYLKLISFWSFQISALTATLIILTASLKGEVYPELCL